MTNDSSIERYRLFIAIQVPEAVRKEMLRVQRQLQSLASHDAIRWTKPEQFHLTLRFLGDVPCGSIPVLENSLRAVCAGASPLHLRARGIGFFPDARAPRVVWIGIVEEENRLLDLQKKVENAVQPFTGERTGEHFSGHVTLGRFKFSKYLNVKELKKSAETLGKQVFGRWTAGEIEMVRSELLPGGPRHTAISVLQLGTEIASLKRS